MVGYSVSDVVCLLKVRLVFEKLFKTDAVAQLLKAKKLSACLIDLKKNFVTVKNRWSRSWTNLECVDYLFDIIKSSLTDTNLHVKLG